jgi:hypothetical protein
MLDWLRSHAHKLMLPVTLACMLLLMLRGSQQESPTEDELTHMVRGIAYWQAPDTRLSYGHPALGNAWTALPVAFDADNLRIDQLAGWESATAASVTKAYITKDYARARAQLMRCRFAAMVLGLLLVTYVFFWTRAIFGPLTALAAMVLVAFNPVVLAQCRYVTTDPPAMLGFVVAIGELVRYLRGARFSIVLMPLALSLGLLTKYSGVMLVPFALCAALVVCLTGRGRFSNLPGKQRFLELAKHAGIAAATVLLSINVVYKFNDTGLTVGEILEKPEPRYWVSSKYDDLMERFTPLPKLPAALPIPVPYTYLFGIAGIRGHTSSGFTSYFWGERIRKAPPIYFPVMLAIKNPEPLLLLLASGAALVVIRRRVSLATAVVAAGAAAFLALATRSNLAMGVRHVLPMIPLLCILAARTLDQLWHLAERRELQAALGAALAWNVVAGATAGPDYLGYFNLLAGGREGGHRISIYGEDWGQDRERFAKVVKERRLSPLYYDPMTSTRALEAKHLDIRYKTLRCGMQPSAAWVAVHALSYRTRDLSRCYPFLAGRTPDIEVYNHIYVFWIPKQSEPQSSEKPPTPTDDEPSEEP